MATYKPITDGIVVLIISKLSHTIELLDNVTKKCEKIVSETDTIFTASDSKHGSQLKTEAHRMVSALNDCRTKIDSASEAARELAPNSHL